MTNLNNVVGVQTSAYHAFALFANATIAHATISCWGCNSYDISAGVVHNITQVNFLLLALHA